MDLGPGALVIYDSGPGGTGHLCFSTQGHRTYVILGPGSPDIFNTVSIDQQIVVFVILHRQFTKHRQKTTPRNPRIL